MHACYGYRAHWYMVYWWRAVMVLVASIPALWLVVLHTVFGAGGKSCSEILPPKDTIIFEGETGWPTLLLCWMDTYCQTRLQTTRAGVAAVWCLLCWLVQKLSQTAGPLGDGMEPDQPCPGVLATVTQCYMDATVLNASSHILQDTTHHLDCYGC